MDSSHQASCRGRLTGVRRRTAVRPGFRELVAGALGRSASAAFFGAAPDCEGAEADLPAPDVVDAEPLLVDELLPDLPVDFAVDFPANFSELAV